MTFEDLEGQLLRLSESEPLQQITGVAVLGEKEFMVTKDTLIPRQKQKNLFLKAPVLFDNCPVGRVLEKIGVGTGCIILEV